jgi:hypothetical protein
MSLQAAKLAAGFVLNTGDNFYWCGIQNTSDYQVKADFVDVYTQDSLQIPFYGCLGNHEYGYNVSAQLALREERDDMDRWILPDRYWETRLPLPGAPDDRHISLIVLDTSPCMSQFRSDDSSDWDPCGEEYPTCSPGSTDDDFEGVCQFHENILSQNCAEQFSWFSTSVARAASTYPNDWLVVMGHAPADELDLAGDWVGTMQAAGVDLYINGHVHALQQYDMDGYGAYITTGAGSMTETMDQDTLLARAKLSGDDKAINSLRQPGTGTGADSDHAHAMEYERKRLAADLADRSRSRGSTDKPGSATSTATTATDTHSYRTIFTENSQLGFTTHTFDDTFDTLSHRYISAKGQVLHSFETIRGFARREYHRRAALKK